MVFINMEITNIANTVIAIMHVKEAAKLLETSNLEVSQALYNVALSMIETENISNSEFQVINDLQQNLETTINESI